MKGKYAFWMVYTVLLFAGISIAISLNAQPVSAECIAPQQVAPFYWQWCVAEMEPPPTSCYDYAICADDCLEACDSYRSQPGCEQWSNTQQDECYALCTGYYEALC